MARHSQEDHASFCDPPIIDLQPLPEPLPLNDDGSGPNLSTSQAWNLYISHFLSTWNIRTYEFAAVIFTAAAYPDTLIAISVRGIVRALASICISSTVGRWVDHTPSRLKVLLSTICINRISVIVASLLWFLILDSGTSQNGVNPQVALGIPLFFKNSIFTLILVFEILEALSTTGNMLSMERDWVVVAASPDGHPYDLTNLNAMMRRIDLVCKLIAPIIVSVVISVSGTTTGVVVVGGMSLGSWAIEWRCARWVWSGNARINALKRIDSTQAPNESLAVMARSPGRIMHRAFHCVRQYIQDLKNYFSSAVWIPSLALAFLHINVMTYSGVFVTYLLNLGFSLDVITIARAMGSVVEISSTVVMPVGVEYLSRARHHDPVGGYSLLSARVPDVAGEEPEAMSPNENWKGGTGGKVEVGLERLGLWGVTWQLSCLIPVVLALWSLSPASTTSPSTSSITALLARSATRISLFPALTLFIFLSLSRLGLWVFDLTTQQLTQTLIVPTQRSSFTGVEYGFVSLFELAQSLLTLVFYRTEDFRYVAAGSCVAVAVSAVGYAYWVRRRRGHLVHWEKMGGRCGF